MVFTLQAKHFGDTSGSGIEVVVVLVVVVVVAALLKLSLFG